MTSPPESLSYREAGVDIDAGDALVERIKPFAKRTMRPEVLAGILPQLRASATGWTPADYNRARAVFPKVLEFARLLHEAGVPMMIGAQLLEGYVPDVDATVVERILDAGGEIAGKAVCEYYCVSGGSHTSSTGPVHNPRKRGYTTGGSSSGSASPTAAGRRAATPRRG